MSINNIERKIRFSNFTLEEYHTLSNHYKGNLLALLENDSHFNSILESKQNYIKPVNTLKAEAEKLSKSTTESISKFGKAVLKFLATGVKGFDDLCIAISIVLMAGGIVTATCISLIISVILYAITIVPFATLIAGLVKIDKALGGYLNKNSDKNVKKFEKLSKNIQSQVDGIKDIRDLEKLVKISESLSDILETPDCIPLEEAKVVANIINVIENRIESIDSTKADIIAMEMDLHADLAPDDKVYSFGESGILESINFGDDCTDTFMTLESIVNKPMLSGEGLLHGIISITTEACSEKSILQFLNTYKNTVKYELVNENYSDLPIMIASKYSLDYVKERCSDLPNVMESCDYMDRILGEIVDESLTEVKETGFNPDPFNIGCLTPLPVASRKTGELLCEICDAEDDDAITEAMLRFGRVTNIIRENYYVNVAEDGSEMIIESDAGKVARGVSNKVEKEFAKTATKDKTSGVKQAVKRTIDPMEKFIQKQYQTLKEKDANERRQVIIKGGTVPKVTRWIKRGIKLLAGAAVGQVIPAAAIITGITFIGYIASDKYLDRKERAKIMKELEDEIMICNEKIEDSRGDDNKQKKYELMRIRNNLQRTRDKIHYGLSN